MEDNKENLKVGVICPSEVFPKIQAAFNQVSSLKLNFIHMFSEEELKSHPQIEVFFPIYGFTNESISILVKHHPKAKLIHSFMAGVDKYLVPEVLQNDDVVVCNAKGAYSESLGEYVSFIMLYFAKYIPYFNENKKNKIWKIKTVEMLQNKTLVIVGYGDIGYQVAKRAKLGFNMKVIGVKRRPELADQRSKKVADQIIGIDKVDEVIKSADFVCGILPAVGDSFHFFNEKRFALMKKEAVFINIGRGNTACEGDLVSALKSGVIAGAGLDVFQKQPLPQTSQLWGLDNVLITPHSADITSEYFTSSVKLFSQNAQAFIGGKELINKIDKKLGY